MAANTEFEGKERKGIGSGVPLLLMLVLSSYVAYCWNLDFYNPFQLSSFNLLCLVALTMYCLGMVVELEELREMRLRPTCVFLGVAAQCTLMPALAWAATQLIPLEQEHTLGVILVGCVPGAMASNVLTMTAHGNVSYSVSLTAVATLLSPLTVPIALSIIGGVTTGGDQFHPLATAWTLFVSVVLPIIMGFLTKQTIPWMLMPAKTVAPKIASFALLWIIASVVHGNRERLASVGVELLLALLTINVLGYVGGYFVGVISSMSPAMRRALALEVGMQNAGLGTALAAKLFGESSAAQIPTAAYTFGCMFTGTVLAGIWSRIDIETECHDATGKRQIFFAECDQSALYDKKENRVND
ncbi:MAG: bile acid:sodium symporter family protein [Planctomycetales bacterium]|nr:bile acid:sodium symporter family protein [Planctomycetales bacterium]